jgi:hypothetical protein
MFARVDSACSRGVAVASAVIVGDIYNAFDSCDSLTKGAAGVMPGTGVERSAELHGGCCVKGGSVRDG